MFQTVMNMDICINFKLTEAQWRHIDTKIRANIGSGRGLLLDSTKPLPPVTGGFPSQKANNADLWWSFFC